MWDTLQRQAGPGDFLGVDDQIEAPAGQGAAQKFLWMLADTGVFNNLVQDALDHRRHDAGIDAGFLAGDPGDAGVGKGPPQGLDER